MEKKMRLYVWEEFCPDWMYGLAVVIAPSLEEAKKKLRKLNKGIYAYEEGKCDMFGKDKWGPYKTYSLDKIRAFAVSGGA
jgi:hypothetical protein